MATPASPAKIGRNDPCPCGSGKKFKACCGHAGTPAKPADPLAAQLERARQAVSRRDLAGTVEAFGQVLALRPNHPEAHAGLGQALCWNGQVRSGLDHLRRAAAALKREAERSRDPRSILALAEQLHHWGDLETALDLAGFAARLNPAEPAARNNLALYLLRVNRASEALPHAQAACRLRPEEPACCNLLAQVEIRLGLFDEPAARLEHLVADSRDPRQTARALMELANLRDRRGDYAGAFDHATKAKQLQSGFPEFQCFDGDALLRSLARNRAGFDRELLGRWNPAEFADGLPAPAFLMGFLRSGTTLTERVLDAHPGVFAADESTLVNGLAAELGRMTGQGEDVPAGLRGIGLEEARALRRWYWRRVEEEYGDEALKKCFVDKVALNSIDLGLIAALFPEARILFALRDPRDVVVSCYFQTFQPAAVTANLLTLPGIARQYAAVMELWLHLRPLIAPRWLELRYEDTVNDFEGTFRRVFELLDLSWRPEVAAFHEHARGRFIATPSFAAVAEPLYRRSLARWRNYEAQLAPVLPLLAPYAEALGYAEP